MFEKICQQYNIVVNFEEATKIKYLDNAGIIDCLHYAFEEQAASNQIPEISIEDIKPISPRPAPDTNNVPAAINTGQAENSSNLTRIESSGYLAYSAWKFSYLLNEKLLNFIQFT